MALKLVAAVCSVYTVCSSNLGWLGSVAGGGLDALFVQSLREPLVEMVNELRVTNTYLRNSASMQFNYTSSQATQHRDPNFKRALIEVSSCQSCKPPPPQLTLLLLYT